MTRKDNDMLLNVALFGLAGVAIYFYLKDKTPPNGNGNGPPPPPPKEHFQDIAAYHYGNPPGTTGIQVQPGSYVDSAIYLLHKGPGGTYNVGFAVKPHYGSGLTGFSQVFQTLVTFPLEELTGWNVWVHEDVWADLPAGTYDVLKFVRTIGGTWMITDWDRDTFVMVNP